MGSRGLIGHGISQAVAAVDLQQEAERSRGLERLKGEFLNIAAHELRSPLGIIRGYASMLSEGMLPEADRGTALARIAEKAEEMARLISDMLETARLETLGVELDTRACRPARGHRCGSRGDAPAPRGQSPVCDRRASGGDRRGGRSEATHHDAHESHRQRHQILAGGGRDRGAMRARRSDGQGGRPRPWDRHQRGAGAHALHSIRAPGHA